jgi:thymidylate synthase (FAD)
MKVISPKVELVTGFTNSQLIERVGRVSYKSENKITEESSIEFLDRMHKSGHWAMFEFGTVFFKVPIGKCPKIISILTDVNKLESKGTRVITKNDNYYITTNLRVLYQLSARVHSLAINPNTDSTELKNELNEFQTSYHVSEPDPSIHKLRATTHWISSIAVSNQALRSRVFSPMQESQRYCNYTKDKFGNEITFIIPYWAYEKVFNSLNEVVKAEIMKKIQDNKKSDWGTIMWNELVSLNKKCAKRNKFWKSVEREYIEEITEEEMLPEEARDVLDKQVKTEFYLCGYLDDWFYEPPALPSSEKAGFFSLRTAMAAQGDIRNLAKDLKSQMEEFYAGPNFIYQTTKQ